MSPSYVLDEINNSKVCTMGGSPISCTISNSGQYVQAYFNGGEVTLYKGNFLLVYRTKCIWMNNLCLERSWISIRFRPFKRYHLLLLKRVKLDRR